MQSVTRVGLQVVGFALWLIFTPKIQADPGRILFCNSHITHYGDLNETGPDGFSDLKEELIGMGYEVDQVYQPEITESLLSDYDIVVMGSNSRSFSGTESGVFSAYIQAGGRAFFLVGQGDGSEFYTSDNDLLDPFGIAYGPTSPWGGVTITEFSVHPVTEGLDQVTALGINPISSVQSPAQAVATLNGTTAIAVAEAGEGKIVAFCDWDTFSNSNHGGLNLYTHDNLTFLQNVLGWLESPVSEPVPARVLFYNSTRTHYGNITESGPDGFVDFAAEITGWGFLVDQVFEPTITQELLSGYGIVVLGSNARSFSPQEVATFGEYVEGGGRTFVIVGQGDGSEYYTSDNALIGQFGITLGPTSAWGIISINDFSDHPVTEGLSTVTALGINPIVDVTATARIVATRQGQGVIAVAEPGEGRVVAFCDWDTFSNEIHGGLNLYTHDNYQFAENVFTWLFGRPLSQQPSPTPTPTNTRVPTSTPTPINAPPSRPIVKILPQNPTTLDDLFCDAMGSVDPEGLPVTYAYQWFRNGEILENETSFLNHEFTSRGQVLECVVTPSDGNGNGPSGSDSVTIVNTPPTAPVVRILPDNPTPDDGLAVYFVKSSTDVDGDFVDYIFEWYESSNAINWTRRPELSGAFRPFSRGEPEASNLYIQIAEFWRIDVTPVDFPNETSFKKAVENKDTGQAISAGAKGTFTTRILPDLDGDDVVGVQDLLFLKSVWKKKKSELDPDTRKIFFDAAADPNAEVGVDQLLSLTLVAWYQGQ